MSGAPSAGHVPVLLDEVVAALLPVAGALVIDATFGAGGYTRRLLDMGAIVHAFDRDPAAAAAAATIGAAAPGRLVFHPVPFSQMEEALAASGIDAVDAVVFDIGVSSMQLDEAERGFSFQQDGPLDMRMAQAGMSAADFLNTADADTIADILFRFGEERQSRRIARAIVAARPLHRTGELARVVRNAIGHRPGAPRDPATRTFQAVRIHVNGELDELVGGLHAAERLLRIGGRLAVVSFHSLEDRIVKQFLRVRSGAVPATSRHMPAAAPGRAPSFDRVARPVRAGETENARNPRARSATLRSAVRTAAPAHPREAVTA